MTHFRKKAVVITAITFDQLVAHGIAQCQAEGRESNILNGMPWSFSYNGHPVTHEANDCYIIPTLEGSMKMGRDDMLITGVKGEIYPCKRDIFETTYEAAPTSLPVVDPGPDSLERDILTRASAGPRVTPADIEAEIVSEHYFTAADGVQGAYRAGGDVHPVGGTPSQATHQTLGLLTFCVLVLRNGFTVTGESACASPENFNAEIGRRIARENAVNKVWSLLGFRLRDRLAGQGAE
ncbi:Gp49 family protein [Pulveribacter sp.]|uniref:Gp49 family protein n=1 Tax=Pulveribacter sp. TaxID=2678893 RepID=UPI0028A9113C|nr:Gp49 family protein [Pulveribacter sp.]